MRTSLKTKVLLNFKLFSMKSVHELSAEEFEELRERYIIEFDLDHDRISDEEIRQYYSGTSFVEEDFFCNMVEEEESLIEKLKLTEQQVHSIVLEWYTNGMCREIFQTEDGEDLEEYLEPIVYR